jgi:RNA-directed DNA polymerase
MAIEARRRNPDTGLGWSLPLPAWPGTGKWAEFRERERSLTAAGESDHLIVLRDGRAYTKGKGVTVVCSPQRPLAPDIVGPGLDEPTFLRAIATKAGHNKAHRFQNLYGHLNVPLLRQAWRSLNQRGAPGVDKITIAQYGGNLDENLERLVEKLRGNEYRSRLIRRKYLPKGNGKERPLGIPVVEDRLLQAAAKLLLEAIYEQDFLPTSYGYRPMVGAGKAVADLTYELQFGRHGYVVEADIKGFFDHLDHDWLLRMLQLRVDDQPFLGLIASWLKAGILERDGTILHPQSGTPQGGVISPILANIYLHYVLDLWFEKRVKPNTEGQAYLIRFADDCAPRGRIEGTSPPCSHAAPVMGVGPPGPPCRRRSQTTVSCWGQEPWW